MPFKYCCFISYRNNDQSQIAKRFIKELEDALHNELSMTLEREIFVDKKGLRGGDMIDKTLSHTLCMSACMVVVYTPTYFSKSNPYCAREYRAMQTLEQQRLPRLHERFGQERGTGYGLIFPLILRGAESLPAEIKERACYTSFDRFLLSSRQISKSPQLQPDIAKLVKDIHTRTQELEAVQADLLCDCNNFTFPSVEAVRPWLDSIVPPPAPFPLLSGSR